jgi:DNA-binding MarR family transcriptional regulator
MSARPHAVRRAPPPELPPRAAELAQVFFDLLLRHKTRFAEDVVELGLTPIQARALLCISPEAPCTMSDVAQELSCGASNITGVVDKLEARGLVERRAHRDDRRSKTVALTRKGSAMRRRLTARLAQPAPWMLALSDEDRAELVAILRRALTTTPA